MDGRGRPSERWERKRHTKKERERGEGGGGRRERSVM